MKFSLKKEDRKFEDTDEEISSTPKIILEIKEEVFNPWDYIRVVNVRGDIEHQATPEEKIIIGHRGNPILGNKHPMKESSIKERDRVIAAHQKDLEADLAIQGPIWSTLQSIAQDIVDNKQKVALACHCSPSRCHLDLVVPVIAQMAENLISNKNNKNINKKINI